jgi:hypothetical protein
MASQIATEAHSCVTLKLPWGETFKIESFNMEITSVVGKRAVSVLADWEPLSLLTTPL